MLDETGLISTLNLALQNEYSFKWPVVVSDWPLNPVVIVVGGNVEVAGWLLIVELVTVDKLPVKWKFLLFSEW